MEKLKIGDVKKFIFTDTGREYIGAVCGICDNGERRVSIEILLKNGEILTYYTERKILQYKAVHLKPELRNLFEKAAEEKYKYDVMKGEIWHLEYDRDNIEDKYEKQIEKYKDEISSLNYDLRSQREGYEVEVKKLYELKGIITLDDVLDMFYESLKKYHHNIYETLYNCYDTKVHADSSGGVTLSFNYEKQLSRSVNSDSYDFLYEEYDGTLAIYYDSPSYKRFCKECATEGSNFTMDALNGTFTRRAGPYLGDKNYLFYSDEIEIFIPKNDCNKEYIEKLVKTIKEK